MSKISRTTPATRAQTPEAKQPGGRPGRPPAGGVPAPGPAGAGRPQSDAGSGPDAARSAGPPRPPAPATPPKLILRLGQIDLGHVPRVAVPLSDVELQRDVSGLKGLADLIELRIDAFQRHDPAYVAQVCREARALKFPLIATVRSADEGGQTRLTDAERQAIYEAVVSHVDAIDIEFHTPLRDRIVKLARAHHKRAIVSFHDFQRTPLERDLVAVAEVARWHSAEIVKLAVTAQSSYDVDRLLGILRTHRDKNLIVIALGPYGVMSRVFFPLVGSLITYAYLNAANAPGQLALAELVSELCRYSPDFSKAKAAAKP
jgi:3-dehydroquinate dehydratase-1